MRQVLVSLVPLLAVAGALPTAAQNLLANGAFDHDLSGWTASASPVTWSAGWETFDAGNDIASGSARLQFGDSTYGAVDGLSQCLPVVAGTQYRLSGQLYIDGDSPPVRIGLRAFWSSHADCSTEESGFQLDTQLEDTLVFRDAIQTAPPGKVAVRVSLYIARQSAAVPVSGRFDNVFFGERDGKPCTPSPFTLCLDDQPGDKRFEVQVDYSTTQGGGYLGVAVPVPLNAQGVRRGGIMWFFEPDNPEMLIKVLAGCDTNGYYWVFYSAGTNVQFAVYVRDTQTERVWTSTNPDRHAAPPVQDTRAFACAEG